MPDISFGIMVAAGKQERSMKMQRRDFYSICDALFKSHLL